MTQIDKYKYTRVAGITGIVISSVTGVISMFLFIPFILLSTFCTMASISCADISGLVAGFVFSLLMLAVSIYAVVSSSSRIKELEIQKRVAEKLAD